MNNYQMFRKIQERDNIIKKYSNDTKEDLIDLVIEKDNIIENLQFKIDKANEIIKDWHQEYNGLMKTNNIYIPKDKPSLFDLRDTLKEDK